MARGNQIVRHWRLLQLLQRRGVGLALQDLSSELEVSGRTLQRDLEFLQQVGFPVRFEADEFGKRFWRLPHDFLRSGPFVLTLTEAVSLHLAENLFDPLAGTHFGDGLQGVLAKIRSHIPAAALDYFAGLEQRFHVRRIGATDYRRHADTISVLSAAARDDQWVRLKYSSLWRSAAYETDFAPYGLVYYEGDLFAVGHSAIADAIRVLKITRIQSVVAAASAFDRPPNFRLDEFFQSSFGIVSPHGPEIEIEVLFRGPEAALVEERLWHASQQHQWLPGEPALFETDEPEQLRATFRLSNPIEFKRWLKSFGAAAEVLKPDWLRQELHTEFQAAAARYA